MPSPGRVDTQPLNGDGLRGAIADLKALLALPETWATLDREGIARSTSNALQAMVNPVGVHVHLPADTEGAALDVRCGNLQPASPSVCAPIGLDGGFVAIENEAHEAIDRLLLDMAAGQIANTLSRRGAEMAAKRLALLVERSSDFIGFAKLDGTPLYVNLSGMALVGLTSIDQLSGLHILDFLAPAERDRGETEAIPAMRTTGHWINETALQRFDDGEIFPVLLDCFRIDDQSTGMPAHFAAVVRDLRPQRKIERGLREQARDSAETAQRRALERDDATKRLDEVQLELFHASRLSVAGQMAGMLAHELSQPLAAALNSASAARRLFMTEDFPADEMRELIEDQLAQTERAGAILRRWRNFVYPGRAASHQPEDLRRLVTEAIDFAFIGPDVMDVSLELYFDPGAPAVRVDRIQIQQVIANLVRNALDALHGCGTPVLRLSTFRRDPKTVEILVADSGAGVDAAMRDRLFEPFQSTKASGMGLGLSICRTIVASHGGTIGYEPRSIGGSLFRLTLPASDSCVAP
jgi:PAS domain S-box-containing protein